MDTLGKRVAMRRRLKGLSQRQLGDIVGMSQQAVDKVEAGSTKRPRRILELARALDLEVDELVNGISEERLIEVISTSSPSRVPSNVSHKLPVYGGKNGKFDGSFQLSDQAIDWIDRPANLRDARDAFAIYIHGQSMMPKYEEGDVAFVHPNVPIKRERYVLIETNDGTGLVRRFIEWEENKLVVSQLNPAMVSKFNRNEIKRVMLIVGSLDS